MKQRVRAVLVTAAMAVGVLAGATGAATGASAHGWVTDPPSRQDLCSTGSTGFDCGQISYEPQSVEAPKGSLLCSGGNAAFAILDDESRDWPRTNVDSDLSITWNLTARHSTDKWEYFVDGQLFKTVNDYGAQPPASLTHVLPGLPQGDHTILARWTVADTANAFYSCIDVTVGEGGGTGELPVDPTDPPVDPEQPCGAAWDADAVYTSGDTVVVDDTTWRAKWWTRGELPGTTGQWGVWENLGACTT